MSKGFTLIELLVAIVIVGILVAVGVPGMQTLLGNMAVRAKTDTLITSLSYARGEAVARVESVSIRSVNNNNNAAEWSNGWEVFVDDNGDCAFNAATDEIIRVVQATADNVTVTATLNAAGCVPFNSQGEMGRIGNNDPTQRGFSITHDNGNAKAISVSVIGYASID